MGDLLEDGAVQCSKDLVEVVDSNGAVLRVKRYRGKNFTPCVVGNVKDHLEQVANMEVRPDDVFITTFPKSGTHWIYEIVNMLLHGKEEYRTNHCFIGVTPVEKINKLESPRILASHLPYAWLPTQLRNNKDIKIINVCRNPKDTCVSFFHYTKKCAKEMYDGEWSGFLDIFMRGDIPFGPWFESITEWEKVRRENPQILFVQYEEVKKNFRKEIMRISEYLGKDYDDEFYDTVEKKCTFTSMNKDKVTNQAWTVLSKDGKSPIYRKGEIGDWKNYFTVSQNEAFDAIYDQKMKDSEVKFHFT